MVAKPDNPLCCREGVLVGPGVPQLCMQETVRQRPASLNGPSYKRVSKSWKAPTSWLPRFILRRKTFSFEGFYILSPHKFGLFCKNLKSGVFPGLKLKICCAFNDEPFTQ